MNKENLKILKLNVSDKENSDKYVLKFNEKEIGYSYIFHEAKNNNIYIFINQENRSNGFGSFLFGEMLKIIKSSKLSRLFFDIEKPNYSANNIVAKFNGQILSEDDKRHWILKL